MLTEKLYAHSAVLIRSITDFLIMTYKIPNERDGKTSVDIYLTPDYLTFRDTAFDVFRIVTRRAILNPEEVDKLVKRYQMEDDARRVEAERFAVPVK
jgi:hypothetical protein